MNKKLTDFTVSGLSQPDGGENTGERIRRQAAMTASLLAFMAYAFDPEQPGQLRLLWDVLNVAAERAQMLTDTLEGGEIYLPAGNVNLQPTTRGDNHA